jgi:hypothetical protein
MVILNVHIFYLRGATRAMNHGLMSAAEAGEGQANIHKKSRIAASRCCVMRMSSSRLANLFQASFVIQSYRQPEARSSTRVPFCASRYKIASKTFILVETDAENSIAFQQA